MRVYAFTSVFFLAGGDAHAPSYEAGGDACVPGQTMVRPGDRTSLKAGGDACAPGQHGIVNPLVSNYLCTRYLRVQTAVDGDTLASDVACLFGCEEAHECGDFLCLAEAVHRDGFL